MSSSPTRPTVEVPDVILDSMDRMFAQLLERLEGLTNDEYSALRDSDDEIWVILSGNGGLETSAQSYAPHGDETVEITRLGDQASAFQPADLITDFDTLPT